ncbi:SH3 beta-barrel fold-containing protein [Alistipes sp.]|uniref:SH3 beta-barrel fold-containing protein n=1 Tax=Alistipes sp. TaxID=1872444 RepID=UPI003AF537F0
MKRNDLQNIMRRAWELYRTTGKAFAVCLSRSWVIFRLIQRMRSSVVQFSYEKIDGTLRKAKGTLKDVTALVKGTGKETPKTVRYFDVDVQAFRSFKIENLITVY